MVLTFQVGKTEKELLGGRRGSEKGQALVWPHRALTKEGVARE